MSLLSVVNDVCRVVGVHEMTSVINDTRNPRTAAEMRSLANEMAQRIAYDTREWIVLTQGWKMDGDGVKEDFGLPLDYQRMLLTSNVYRSTAPMTPMIFINNPDEWLHRRLLNYNDPRGEWALLQNPDSGARTMFIRPIMGAGISAAFVFLSKNCIKSASGGFSSEFTADTDTFRLPERLLKLGMIWQWKAQKGSPYAEDMASYEDALRRVAGADRPAPIIVDRLPISQNARVAFPWPSTWP